MSNLTPEQQRHKDLRDVIAWTKESNTDSISLIQLLKEIALSCVDEGVRSERVCMKSDTGTVEVVERFPAIAVSAIKQIHEIVKDCQKELDKAPPPDPIININISRRRLEDVLEEADNI